MYLNEVEEVTDFIWRRNPEGHNIASKDQFFEYLIKIRDTVYVCRNKENGIDGVALYQKYNDTINFISLTVREEGLSKAFVRKGVVKALREIVKKEKVKRVCWMNAKYNFRIFKTRG